MIIICDSIVKKELNPIQKHYTLEDILTAAKKAQVGLGNEIAGSIIPNTRLRKVYLTSSGSAGRALFLIKTKEGIVTPIIVRLKKDKKIDDNMTIKNPEFKKILTENLDLIIRDFEECWFKKYNK